MNFAITVVSPPGYIHSAAFHEVAESLHYALLQLGHDSILTTEGILPGRRHIVLGSNLLPHYPLPIADDAILYNLEQIEIGSSWFSPALIALFQRYVLWDYSQQNTVAFKTLDVNVAQVLPIGYIKELTRIPHLVESDIDVLFFGSMNARRQEIVNQMSAAGLQVRSIFGMYGNTRDAYISRAKLLLNVHFYDAKILELVRISYLLANHCTVLSEHSSDSSEDATLATGVAFANYKDLTQRARELVNNPEECISLARRGFEIMSARPIMEYLRNAIEQDASGLNRVHSTPINFYN
jgi:hypothetical protein